jgi:hypothetical protein
MPYQSAFTLLIIGGAFAVGGGLVGSLNWLQEGTRKRRTAVTHLEHHLHNRDLAIQQFLQQQRK